ncbi:ribonuclease HII [Pseudohongiella spirulinae]|uniref:Ribonuclease HII n=1 Tax=Pseudohongiella spirulinae TaxID=1249552 RepID=A0A0S2KD74_9GAMM|nr:ribonuclease HII [Pseudohongiella spirulinae]ALO46051.1 Ribonuclease HII [Pseudohongiella spirulinae]
MEKNCLLTGEEFFKARWGKLPQGYVVGVDEAGRGPLAGPVSAAAVILPVACQLPGLDDSKRLTEKKRSVLYEQICEQAISFSIVFVQAAEIDRINILQASMLAMHRAVESLGVEPSMIFVDGNRCPVWPYNSEAVVKGDSKLQCIAAASVLAKVARDHVMLELDASHPGYGFARHKGYPTRQHFEALHRLGPSEAHRMSFAPVRELSSQV